MNWAAVPKAAIYKDGQALLFEYKIGPAKQLGPSPPAVDLKFSKRTSKQELRCQVVSALYARHNLGAFLSRKYIGHGRFDSSDYCLSLSDFAIRFA